MIGHRVIGSSEFQSCLFLNLNRMMIRSLDHPIFFHLFNTAEEKFVEKWRLILVTFC